MQSKNTFWISVIWTILIICSFSWNYYIVDSNTIKLVENKAQSFFNQILVTRSWNSFHGGVYVPVSEVTQPNEYLVDSLRDLTSTGGMKLTKINPAFMTRQIAEINKLENDLQFHITSTNPIRPANKADDWEEKALKSFGKDKHEVLEHISKDSFSQYRYIAALVTEESCLKCHAVQGYKLGDIRGGISISFPSKLYTESENRQLLFLLLAHLIILLVGLLGISRYFRMLKKLFGIIDKKNNELETESTLLRKSNEELKDSLERNKAIVSAMPDILFSIDQNGCFTNCQVSDSNFLLAPVDAIVGKSIRDVLPPEIAEKGTELISLAIRTGKLQVFEYYLDVSDSRKWFELRIVNSSSTEVLAISRDITDRKRAEEEISFKNQQLLEAIADKDRLMSILAHDLKNPFNAILGLSQLLTTSLDQFDKPKIESFARLINNSAKNTYDLLEDMLMWARSQSGKIPFRPQNLVFSEVLQSIMTDSRLIADRKSIALNYQETNNIIVYADFDMLKTVLRNLVSNAIKFTQNGGKIEISIEQQDSEVIITVSDNGIGISPSAISKLFDKSKTHTTSGTEQEGGTGLGLFICLDFVEKHNGLIWVESEVGIGSMFKFSLPTSK